jgi:hypothetical protein
MWRDEYRKARPLTVNGLKAQTNDLSPVIACAEHNERDPEPSEDSTTGSDGRTVEVIRLAEQTAVASYDEDRCSLQLATGQDKSTVPDP